MLQWSRPEMSQIRETLEACGRAIGFLGFGLAVDPHWPTALLLVVIACTFNPTLGMMARLTVACLTGVFGSTVVGDASFGIGCSLVGVAIAISLAVQLTDRLASMPDLAEAQLLLPEAGGCRDSTPELLERATVPVLAKPRFSDLNF